MKTNGSNPDCTTCSENFTPKSNQETQIQSTDENIVCNTQAKDCEKKQRYMIKLVFMKNEALSDLSSDKAVMSNKSAPAKESILKPSIFSKRIQKEKKIFNISKEIKQKTQTTKSEVVKEQKSDDKVHPQFEDLKAYIPPKEYIPTSLNSLKYLLESDKLIKMNVN